MKASRLLSILITLQVRGRVSARELAEQLEVSKRTIYRDVDSLSAAGVPIYAEHGAAGGFALLDGWRTRLTGMTPDEALSMAFTGVPGAAMDLGVGSAAAAARLKLLASLPAAASEGARAVADRFHLDPIPWHRRPNVSRSDLQTLARAVWDARRIRIRYESWEATKTRLLEPLGIVLKAGEWYFVASHRGRIGIHKLDKAKHLALTEEAFERPATFNLAEAWEASVASFEAGLRRETARLRFAETALSRIDRLGADMAEPLLAATPDDKGWREADVAIESVAYAAGLILGFGQEIEVLSPPALRLELARRAAAVTALYDQRTAAVA